MYPKAVTVSGQQTWAKLMQFRINRHHLAETAWVAEPQVELEPGQVRFALETFALSANNITYADLGERFSYWQFFPTEAGMGLLPIWGFARVVESKAADYPVGMRAYGYFPLATHAVLQPKTISTNSFLDQAEHRSKLPTVYQHYQRWHSPPDAIDEARYALLRPLYMTSWLCADFVQDQHCFGAEQIVILSASSKTALSLGQALSALGAKVRRIGLTSEANVAFCRRSGCFDEVLDYRQIETMPLHPSVVVDMAGNPALLKDVHQRLAGRLTRSISVGLSHRGDLASSLDGLPGPKPELFFAPAQVKKRLAEHGTGWIERESNAHWQTFLTASEGYLPVQLQAGREAVALAYQALLQHRARADIGLGFHQVQ